MPGFATGMLVLTGALFIPFLYNTTPEPHGPGLPSAEPSVKNIGWSMGRSEILCRASCLAWAF